MRTPENMDENPNDLDPTSEGDIKMEYSSEYLCHPSIREVTQIPCKHLDQYRYHAVI